MPAQLRITLGNGHPSHSVDLGTAQEAESMMRRSLRGSRKDRFDKDTESGTPKVIDWGSAPLTRVVPAFTEQLVRAGRRLESRGRRHS